MDGAARRLALAEWRLLAAASARERERTIAAQALAGALADEAAHATAELAALRAEMIAVRDELPDEALAIGVDRLLGPLPLGGDELPDEALAVVCRFLGARELGRLACVSRRFTERTLTEPGGGARLSPIEEGARMRLVAVAAAMNQTIRLPRWCQDEIIFGSFPAAATRSGESAWLRALRCAESRLVFIGYSYAYRNAGSVASEDGASPLRETAAADVLCPAIAVDGSCSTSAAAWCCL